MSIYIGCDLDWAELRKDKGTALNRFFHQKP